ncbi:MAG: fibronectin type III domain-containing protein [Gammaproteobacteria bacterium]|jgi:hypothetical protein
MTHQRILQLRPIRLLAGVLLTAQLNACGSGGSGEEGSAGASAAAAGGVTIGWTAPVARTDGSSLSMAEIDGYRVYYGQSEGNYPNRIDVNDSAAVETVINGLPAGTYYFVVTAYDAAGRESEFSPPVIQTI